MVLFVLLIILVSTQASVLVIGKGKIGVSCAQRLLSQGIACKVLVRSTANMSPEISDALKGAELIEGDVTDAAGLDSILSQGGIESVIDVHGVSPPRFVKFTDLFRLNGPSKTDKSHPYVVNCLGTLNLIESMQKHNIKKLVRITGALVTISCYNKFVALFNFLLSFSNKYHEMSEQAIRQSGLDYTVIRPSGLSNMPSAQSQTLPPIGTQSTPRYLIAVPGDAPSTSDNKEGSIPVPSSISKEDIAELCVQCATSAGYLPKSTIVTCSLPGSIAEASEENKYLSGSTFSELFGKEEVRAQFKDTKPIALQQHERAVQQYAVMVGLLVAVMGKSVEILVKRVLPVVWKKVMGFVYPYMVKAA